jgi:hypothetical protein
LISSVFTRKWLTDIKTAKNMEVTNWLKYWRDALITRERLAVDEKVLWGATTCERADALNGILQDQDTIRELKNLGRDAASGVGQRLILAPYVWSQPAQSGRPSTAYPTLVASVAVPAILDSNGELAPDPAAYPYIPRALLTPSLAALTVGSMDDWTISSPNIRNCLRSLLGLS